MKKIILIKPVIFFAAVLLLFACKKDYIVGGSLEDTGKYANTLTYDVLKTNPLYDTLVQLIDAAGLKDKINEAGTTFFAPNDYSILGYLQRRTFIVQNTINQNSKFALDSLVYYLQNNIKNTRDSLLMYLIKKPLNYDVLTEDGAIYPTALTGDTAIVSYELTRDFFLGYNSLVTGGPRIVYFTHLWYHYDVSAATPAKSVPVTIGVRTLIRTSGIITKNGIMNGLESSHSLFFYGTKR
jgi:hypothetical protein